MVRFMRWKASPTRVVQSSGSSLSAIEVDPAMSANRTVIGRRSLTPAPGARSSEAELVIPGEMLRPACVSSTADAGCWLLILRGRCRTAWKRPRGRVVPRGRTKCEIPLCVENAAVRQRAEDDQQDGRPDEGNHDFDHDVGGHYADKAGQPSTKKAPQDPDHDVPDETHAFARKHLAGQEPGDATDDDPDDETHS